MLSVEWNSRFLGNCLRYYYYIEIVFVISMTEGYL